MSRMVHKASRLPSSSQKFSLPLSCLGEPVCILGNEQGKIIKINHAFEILTGYGEESILELSSLGRLLYKRDFRSIQKRLECMEKEEYLCEEIHLISKDRVVKEVELTIRKIYLQNEVWFLCTFHDIASRKELERELRAKLDQEKEKVLANAKETLQITNFLEKFHSFSLFLDNANQCKDISQFLSKATQWMSSKQGLGCSHVAFFLMHGEYLELRASNRECPLQKFHCKKNHKIAQVAREGKPYISENTTECMFPLVYLGNIQGVLQIFVDEADRLLFLESESLKKAYLEFLGSIVHFLQFFLSSLSIQEKQQEKITMDFLTRCHTYEYFAKRLEETWNQGKSFGLVLLEIEQVDLPWLENSQSRLKKFSEILLDLCSEDHFLSRVGDNKFALLLKEKSLREALLWLQRFKGILKKELNSSYQNTSLTFSASLVMPEKKEETIVSLWEKSLSCLQQAKIKGGDRILYWEGGIKQLPQQGPSKLM